MYAAKHPFLIVDNVLKISIAASLLSFKLPELLSAFPAMVFQFYKIDSLSK